MRHSRLTTCRGRLVTPSDQHRLRRCGAAAVPGAASAADVLRRRPRLHHRPPPLRLRRRGSRLLRRPRFPRAPPPMPTPAGDGRPRHHQPRSSSAPPPQPAIKRTAETRSPQSPQTLLSPLWPVRILRKEELRAPGRDIMAAARAEAGRRGCGCLQSAQRDLRKLR